VGKKDVVTDERIKELKKFEINLMRKSDFTILVADDDPDYLFQTVTNLEKAGYKTVAVESQAEAESVISKFKPSLAIFDLMMESDDSGFILCYRIKRKYPDVPVILATAVAHETGISFSLDSETEKSWIKADKYLEKGIRKEQLDQEIMKLLKI
jgi:two-component system alkaline phosphatase synthesis response regulator PhoP